MASYAVWDQSHKCIAEEICTSPFFVVRHTTTQDNHVSEHCYRCHHCIPVKYLLSLTHNCYVGKVTTADNSYWAVQWEFVYLKGFSEIRISRPSISLAGGGGRFSAMLPNRYLKVLHCLHGSVPLHAIHLVGALHGIAALYPSHSRLRVPRFGPSDLILMTYPKNILI